jgi:hypothetical protein
MCHYSSRSNDDRGFTREERWFDEGITQDRLSHLSELRGSEVLQLLYDTGSVLRWVRPAGLHMVAHARMGTARTGLHMGMRAWEWYMVHGPTHL